MSEGAHLRLGSTLDFYTPYIYFFEGAREDIAP